MTMITQMRTGLMCAMLMAGATVGWAEAATADDPTGIIKKPIPDKTVVFTFDDGCLSGATIAAPILKKHGFGGTFYVSDAYGFRERKDWYMTWRQIKGMADDGFEIGNHTRGHGMLSLTDEGGLQAYIWTLEDEAIANRIPKPTTLAWPFYIINTKFYPLLTSWGYIFGLGGYGRVYRPAVDHPLDIPSFAVGGVGMTMEGFISAVQQATAGRVVVLTFHGTPGKYEVTREAADDFVLNQLNFGSSSLTLISKGTLVFAKSQAHGALPYMNSQNRAEVTLKAPLRLDADFTIDGLETDDTRVFLPGVISGTGALIKNGPHTVYLTNAANTYSGGTIINDGCLSMHDQGLGTGPVTMNKSGTISFDGPPVTNALTSNGGCISGGSNAHWNGPVKLSGNTKVHAHDSLEFNNKEGGISGPGGLTQTGHPVDHGIRSGAIKLLGRNTYTGPTKVEMGLLEVMSSLYNNEPVRWTPVNITVNGAAGDLRLHVGGAGEFTSAQAATMLKNISTGVNQNGLMAGATFGLDTTNATTAQELSINIADSQGPGGGSVTIKKCGAGTLKLAGTNTYTGQTIITGGTLSIDSFNSVAKRKASSSLGAPKTDADAEIMISGGSTLLYTGKGETTDRNLNLPSGGDTITLDQSGTGLLKLTSPFVMSGFAENKTIVLAGSSAGPGELAFNIDNVYDRKGKAMTSLTKAGAGTWTLSGTNTRTQCSTSKAPRGRASSIP